LLQLVDRKLFYIHGPFGGGSKTP